MEFPEPAVRHAELLGLSLAAPIARAPRYSQNHNSYALIAPDVSIMAAQPTLQGPDLATRMTLGDVISMKYSLAPVLRTRSRAFSSVMVLLRVKVQVENPVTAPVFFWRLQSKRYDQ
jgi:hypothetical protein